MLRLLVLSFLDYGFEFSAYNTLKLFFNALDVYGEVSHLKLLEFRVGGLSELAQEFLCEKYPGGFSQCIDFKNVFLSHYELVLQVQPVSLLLVLCLALFLDHPLASLL